MAEAGENSHGKKLSLQKRLLAVNTDKRQETCADALPKGYKIMQLSAEIQAQQENCWQLICWEAVGFATSVLEK